MQLFYSLMSPFARKVRVVAFELGLAERLELVTAAPYTEETVRGINPLSKIPVLIPDDGGAIYDSPVICEYLERLAGTSLTPATGPERWAALTLQALADGMGDAALAIVRERLRQGEHRQDLFDRQIRALIAALDQLERDGLAADRFGIGEIAVAAQLAYLDGRKVLDWREGRPNLVAWFRIRQPALLHGGHGATPGMILFGERDHYRGLISFIDKRHWRVANRRLCIGPWKTRHFGAAPNSD